MQRRAAAISIAFFLVIAAGAYAFIGMAEEPDVAIEAANQAASVSGTGTLVVAGVEYDVTDLNGTAGEASATWLNESARYTATLENDTTVSYQGANYTVVVPNVSSPESFTLREFQPIDLPTVTQDGVEYVVIEENGDKRLEPVSEYLPEPTVHEFALGDEIEYDGNTTTVASLSTSEVTVEWFGPRTEDVSFTEGENTTLSDSPYLATFPDAQTMVLTTAYEDYASDQERIDYYHERISGLWGVAILSGLAALLMLGVAYLPSRY